MVGQECKGVQSIRLALKTLGLPLTEYYQAAIPIYGVEVVGATAEATHRHPLIDSVQSHLASSRVGYWIGMSSLIRSAR